VPASGRDRRRALPDGLGALRVVEAEVDVGVDDDGGGLRLKEGRQLREGREVDVDLEVAFAVGEAGLPRPAPCELIGRRLVEAELAVAVGIVERTALGEGALHNEIRVIFEGALHTVRLDR